MSDEILSECPNCHARAGDRIRNDHGGGDFSEGTVTGFQDCFGEMMVWFARDGRLKEEVWDWCKCRSDNPNTVTFTTKSRQLDLFER